MREEMGNLEISYLLFALSNAMHVDPRDISDDHSDFAAERDAGQWPPFYPFAQLQGEQPDKGSARPMRRYSSAYIVAS